MNGRKLESPGAGCYSPYEHIVGAIGIINIVDIVGRLMLTSVARAIANANERPTETHEATLMGHGRNQQTQQRFTELNSINMTGTIAQHPTASSLFMFPPSSLIPLPRFLPYCY